MWGSVDLVGTSMLILEKKILLGVRHTKLMRLAPSGKVRRGEASSIYGDMGGWLTLYH